MRAHWCPQKRVLAVAVSAACGFGGSICLVHNALVPQQRRLSAARRVLISLTASSALVYAASQVSQ